MAGFRIEGSVTGNVAEVDADNNLKVNLPTEVEESGVVVIAGLFDDGAVTNTREVIPIQVSEEARLNVGVDSVIFNDSFNYGAQNTSNYRYPVATQAVSHATTVGYVTLNSGSSTSINTNCAIQTYRTFPVFGGFQLNVKCSALHTQAPQSNAVTEWGLFGATLPGAAIPTDGVYFRFTNIGEFRCVINFNGTESASAALTVPAANENHAYELLISEEACVFYVDGTIVYDVDTPANFAQPQASGAQPFTARHYIAGSAPALAMQFKIGAIDINLGDMNTTKPWAHVMSSMGMSAYQGQNGGTMGSTALYTNSLAPGAGAAMTNTTAALTAGFGGQFTAQPTLAASTDGILCSYQNPVGSATQTPRTIVICGVRIQGICSAAITGGPLLYLYSLAFGHTAVSMATAEAATTKAPRRIALGMESFVITTPIGTLGQGVTATFDAPISVNPGEFVAICGKNIGTVSSAGTITWLITFDAYNE